MCLMLLIRIGRVACPVVLHEAGRVLAMAMLPICGWILSIGVTGLHIFSCHSIREPRVLMIDEATPCNYINDRWLSSLLLLLFGPSLCCGSEIRDV